MLTDVGRADGDNRRLSPLADGANLPATALQSKPVLRNDAQAPMHTWSPAGFQRRSDQTEDAVEVLFPGRQLEGPQRGVTS